MWRSCLSCKKRSSDLKDKRVCLSMIYWSGIWQCYFIVGVGEHSFSFVLQKFAGWRILQAIVLVNTTKFLGTSIRHGLKIRINLILFKIKLFLYRNIIAFKLKCGLQFKHIN